MIPAEHYTVNAGRGLLISDLGISPVDVLRRAGLPDDLFSRGQTILTSQQYFALWRALEDEAGDPALPIRIGRAISVEAFDPPIFAALCSPDLNVAASRIAKYKKLIGPTRLIVARSDVDTTLELRWPRHAVPPVSLSATELVFWVALARLATRAELRPVRVTSPHPPDTAQAYRDYLGVRIGKGPAYTVCFSARDAARPFLTANEPMWEFFEPELRRRLGQLEVGSTMEDRVRAALLRLLPTGRGTMRAVANELAVSTRTLQRQLKGEGTGFQALLNETRESLARHYLADGQMSAAEISFLLGYEEPSSFYRAFHGWTGQTPQRVRLARV
jgi:AraC-like DNA-binding protein